MLNIFLLISVILKQQKDTFFMVGLMHTKFFSNCGFDSQAGEIVVC